MLDERFHNRPCQRILAVLTVGTVIWGYRQCPNMGLDVLLSSLKTMSNESFIRLLAGYGIGIPIESTSISYDNENIMSIDNQQNDVLSDMQAVADAVAARRPVDPEVAARVRERSHTVQEKLQKKFGVREIAVDLIRSVRDQ